ncbi:MAG TPA: tRNA pseudouridine(55) synthase TruB [Gammaproteobacteria bacterium]|nr:tRNA pseudouridine(55) synthase TruB [Gammaproteobacteria bacterium]
MKPVLKKINGILLLDKPLHFSSNGALQRIKRLFGAKKAGHTGSLDPLATGMLPLCFGAATRLSQFLLDSDKQYLTEVRLGIKTTTGDAEGDVIETRPVVDVDAEKIKNVLTHFVGRIEQIPPMFSALKYKGKPLYALARQGLSVERQARAVFIHACRLISCTEASFVFDVHCSKGTYIRTLVEDIGERLGCGAYVTGLRRVAVSPYQQNKMYELSELEGIASEAGPDGLMRCLLPIDSSVSHLPRIQLSASGSFYVRTGQAVSVPELPFDGLVRLFSEHDQFMGIGEVLEGGRVSPKRLVSDD